MTPAQLARRRASREAWRQRNPFEWRARRARKRLGLLPDGPAAVRQSGAGRSGSPAAIMAEVEAIIARCFEIKTTLRTVLEAPNGPAPTAGRSGSPAARPAPPLARRDLKPPPEYENYPGVSLPAAAAAGGGLQGGGAAAAAAETPEIDSIWRDAEVGRLATARRLDLAVERRKFESYRAERWGAGRSEPYTVRRVLRWLETAHPPAPIAAASASTPVYQRSGRGRREPTPERTAYWNEYRAEIREQQRKFLEARARGEWPVLNGEAPVLA